MPQISIVSPVYNAADNVDELVKRILIEVSKITSDFEIILVEDGSVDDSWKKIEENCKKDIRIKGIKLSRNFGQHYAISAGLDNSRGDRIIVMDCDLQDPPEEIIKLVKKSNEGYDIVLGRRINRKDSVSKKTFSKIFYLFLSYLTGTKQDASIANFGIYNRNVINAICSMKESIRYFPTMVKWVGFKSTSVEIEHAERATGKTSYNFKKLLRLAFDIILAYSDMPLRLTIKLGFAISIISFVFAIATIILWFNGQIKVLGYASLIISIWFLSGLIIFILGVIGLYIGKTFERVKERPIYIISNKEN